MAPKRSNREGDNSEATGREKKKLKISASRAIAVQSVPQPEASTSAISSTSITPKPTHFATGRPDLPAVMDVEKFVEARAFEINAMQVAMKNANAASTHRVWQTLPRHLRRRAASHDVRRVPLRLRDRARSEMDVRKVAPRRSLPKAGKDKRVSRNESFLKRQRKIVWLETHIWHAKRMHMENLWGYRLAVQPTEKAYRASHRASQHDTIIHDASYYTILEVRGPELFLKLMLDRICDPQKAGPGSLRYVSGSRTNETHVYKSDCYPYGLVGPATFMWQPLPLDRLVKNGQHGIAAGKGKEKEQPQEAAPQKTDALHPRSVWIRFHPSIYGDMLDTIKQVASQTLADYKARNENSEELKVDLIDRRGQLNIFEIMGPKSSQVLKGAMRPVAADNRQDFLQFWNSLGDLQSPSSVPRGMIIGATVNDPRLSFPPKNTKLKINSSQGSPSKIVFPSVQLASSDLWEEARRNGIKTPRYSKKELDERRAKNDIPGTSLNPRRQDDRIPVILIQRSLESQSSDASQGVHGWTLMIPAGWSMSFFSSLTYTGSRVGGQRERQTQAFEAATLHFPRDYPFTRAYDEWSSNQAKEDKERWQRKPPAKRVNFEKLGTMHPWRADWHELLRVAKKDVEPAFIPAQREIVTEDDMMGGRQEIIQPWLLRGSELSKIISNLSSVFSHGAALLSEINRLRLKRKLDQLDNNITPMNLLKGALVNIKITMCAGGSLEDLAMIYVLPDSIALQWQKALYIRRSSRISLEDDTPQETTLANIVPNQKAIIGYITTGHYSLARGYAYGLGAVALTRLIEVVQQNLRLHPKWNLDSPKPTMLVGVRNTNGTQCRSAYLEVLAND